MMAVNFNRNEIAKFLIDEGADIELIDDFGFK